MKDLTIMQVAERTLDLKAEISGLLKKFTKETGCKAEGLSIKQIKELGYLNNDVDYIIDLKIVL